MNINLNKTPNWLLSGVIIFPVLIFFGIILYLLSSGNISLLFWLIIPSIFFEEMLETCCYTLSNNYALNLLFAMLFWFATGTAVGWTTDKIKKHAGL